MFKVGDRVKDVTIGMFGVVAAVDGVGAVSVYWDDQPGEASAFWPAKDFVKAFKSGDRVTTSAVGDAGEGVVTEDSNGGGVHVDFASWYGHCVENPAKLSLAVEEPEGPVRTVTRKEVIAGTYGAVTVEADRIRVQVWRDSPDRADMLRKAAATLLTLADALE